MKSDIDRVDLAILDELQRDGRVSNAKLASTLAISETPCWRRLKRLEDLGYIEGYHAELNRRKLGFGVVAFVHLAFSNHTDEATAQFEKAINSAPEVLSCHNVTGRSDFLLQVVAADIDSYGRFIDSVLRKIPGVTSIESHLSLREVKATQSIPLESDHRAGRHSILS
jgi:DNA-binding Lrp family transcriptional regulator